MGLCGRGVEPSARLPALTALKLRLCKSEASALAQSQTRLLWHVEQLLVCLGLSCHFPLQQQTLFYQTMYLESWDHFWRVQNNGPAGCGVVTHHFSLSTGETLSHRNSSGPALALLPPSFWFLWNRNIEKNCRKCTHIQVSHRHPSLSERGATRLPQSKNGWWASVLQQDVCTVFNQGRLDFAQTRLYRHFTESANSEDALWNENKSVPRKENWSLKQFVRRFVHHAAAGLTIKDAQRVRWCRG